MSTPVSHPADDWALVDGRAVWAGPGDAPVYPGAPTPRRRHEQPAPAEAPAPAPQQNSTTTDAPSESVREKGRRAARKDGEA